MSNPTDDGLEQVEHIPGQRKPADPAEMVVIRYTNHRGETADRRIAPMGLMFQTSEWHPEPQWIMMAWDFDKRAWRYFTMKDITEWRPWKGGMR